MIFVRAGSGVVDVVVVVVVVVEVVEVEVALVFEAVGATLVLVCELFILAMCSERKSGG